MRHAPSLTSSLNLVEAETLPSWQVLLSCRSTVLWPPPTSHLASSGISPLRFIPVVTAVVACRPDETSPVPSSTVATSRTPYPGEFFAAASQGLWTSYVQPPLLLPSPCVTGSALSGSPSGGLTYRGCKFHLMLRAAALRPFLREIQRFNTTSHPAALVACYLAA